MKKFYILFSLTFPSVSQLIGQNNFLTFDGTSDYVDLGSNAMTGVRTVELWFTPAFTISPTSLTADASLVVRNDATQNDEFALSIGSSSMGTYAGRIVFGRNYSGVANFIGSNSNTWFGGTCYHVAAVIDPISGLKMYVDGVLQTDTDPFSLAPAAASEITGIGRYGNSALRYFTGRIDEVRFWTVARSSSEIISSYQYSMGTSATGLYGYWPMNEGSGTTTVDATVNTSDGTIVGATWGSTGACTLIGIEEASSKKEFELNVYPNPINENSVVIFEKPSGVEYSLNVTDVTGKIVWSQTGLKEEQVTLNQLVKFKPGVYFVTAILDDNSKSTVRVIVSE